MTSSTTPNSPTRSPRSDAQRGRFDTAWSLALAVASVLAAGAAHAHGEAEDALPADTGVRLSAAAAVAYLDSKQTIPSQRMRGFLLQGDSGADRDGLGLEHTTLGAAWRLNGALGAELTVGQHGSDPAHVESAWVQWRRDVDGRDDNDGGQGGDRWWLLTAGRQRPALGAAMGQAGHFDRFALMPLAKQMATHGDWMDDGLQLGWRQNTGAEGASGRWSADAGLWRGRVFPGGATGPLVPTLHLGWGQGPWQLDGFAAGLQPEQRGSTTSANAGHSHTAPVCTPSFKDVACFSGRSTLAGGSVVWAGAQSPLAWPITLTASGWLRDEAGQLESANGSATYRAQNRGGWLQALWDVAPRWQVGARLERATTAQSLNGPGASLLATETGLAAYQPASRQVALLAWVPTPQLSLSMELGRERGAAATGTGSQAVNFAVLRLQARTDWLSAP